MRQRERAKERARERGHLRSVALVRDEYTPFIAAEMNAR